MREQVIAVPAYFGAEQREATLQAGRLAGLSRIQLLQGGSLRCTLQTTHCSTSTLCHHELSARAGGRNVTCTGR